MKYTIVIEKGLQNYSAYVPDLAGCVATGKTREIVLERMKKALQMHVDGMIEDGLTLPEPTTSSSTVSVSRVRKLAGRPAATGASAKRAA
ncbi:MAG: type II toxin-antitoxin system HicB family antitoxin [bacterium]